MRPQPIVDKATPLKLPVRLDLDAYKDVVIHDANWRRIASFPKTEVGIAMAQQVTDALNQSAGVDAAQKALVLCAIPYEALLMDRESRKWIAPEVWSDIEKAVAATRAALAQLDRLRKGEADV